MAENNRLFTNISCNLSSQEIANLKTFIDCPFFKIIEEQHSAVLCLLFSNGMETETEKVPYSLSLYCNCLCFCMLPCGNSCFDTHLGSGVLVSQERHASCIKCAFCLRWTHACTHSQSSAQVCILPKIIQGVYTQIIS